MNKDPMGSNLTDAEKFNILKMLVQEDNDSSCPIPTKLIGCLKDSPPDNENKNLLHRHLSLLVMCQDGSLAWFDIEIYLHSFTGDIDVFYKWEKYNE